MRRPASSSSSSTSAFRRRAVVLGALSVAVAVATAGVVWTLVSEYQSSVANVVADPSAERVVAAKRPLGPGTVLTADDLVMMAAPPSAQEGAFHDVDELVGKTVADQLFPGEPVRAGRLVDGPDGLSMDAIVPEGRRAVTVLVSRSAAVGGRVRPGSRVDVILTIRPERGAVAKEWVADTILQNVRVIGVGDRIGAEASSDPDEFGAAEGRRIYVTFDLEPEQGERLALASARGQLLLALRSPSDDALEPYGTPVMTNSVLSLPDSDAPERPTRARGRGTQIILGGRLSRTVHGSDTDEDEDAPPGVVEHR